MRKKLYKIPFDPKQVYVMLKQRMVFGSRYGVGEPLDNNLIPERRRRQMYDWGWLGLPEKNHVVESMAPAVVDEVLEPAVDEVIMDEIIIDALIEDTPPIKKKTVAKKPATKKKTVKK